MASYFDRILVFVVELVETESEWQDDQERIPFIAHGSRMFWTSYALIALFHCFVLDNQTLNWELHMIMDTPGNLQISSTNIQLSMAM